jgi:hypothetical protein
MDQVGAGLLHFTFDDIQCLKQRLTEPRTFAVFMAWMNEVTWINERMHMRDWVQCGGYPVADLARQHDPAMGLALMAVAA